MKTLFFILLSFISYSFASVKPIVTTTLAPYAYAIEKIAKDACDVHILITDTTNPHLYEAKPSDISKLRSSIVWFYTGEDIDKKLLEKVSIKTINLNAEVPLYTVGCCQHHKTQDLHTWLDPEIYKQQALIILNELIVVFPEKKELFENNYKELSLELDQLKELISIKADNPDFTFVVAHGAYHYLCTHLHLKQVTIEKEGKEATLKEIQTLFNQLKETKPKKIFAQIQHDDSGAKRLADLTGANVVYVNPYQKNYPEAIKEILKEIP